MRYALKNINGYQNGTFEEFLNKTIEVILADKKIQSYIWNQTREGKLKKLKLYKRRWLKKEALSLGARRIK